MSYLRTVLLVIAAPAIMYLVYTMRVERVQDFGKKQVEHAEKRETEAKEALKAENEARHNAELVKVFVRAKDAKTCMKELNTDVIDNSVIECNKDHYIELRRDEAEKLKE